MKASETSKLPAEVIQIISSCRTSNRLKASWQLLNSLGLYISLWAVMFFTGEHILLTIILSILAGTLLIRVFIIFHDCAHNSFFPSTKLNTIIGRILSIFVFTPFEHWRWEHNVHHATSGKLNSRNTGDITTLTVSEYNSANRSKKILYRIYRHPFTLFIVGSTFRFLLQQRFASKDANKKRRLSVWLTNISIIVFTIGLISIYGIKQWMIIQFTIVAVASSIGIWLFYIQHQFEDAYWTTCDKWNHVDAAMLGSSFYKLPKLLQWLTGNIGFHHIHHLNPKIPNYHLEKCHNAHSFFNTVKTLGIRSSFETLNFKLWDEQLQKLVPFEKGKQT